jgi:hypothetical protein
MLWGSMGRQPTTSRSLRQMPWAEDCTKVRRTCSMSPAVRRDPDARAQVGFRVTLMRTALCLALCSQVACAGLTKKPLGPDLEPWPEIRPGFRVETLRARMHEYSITFAAEIDLAATAIERRADDATIRRNALLWRVRAVPEMRKACFRLEPISALVDAWIFARQMDQLFREGGGASAFGAFQSEAIAVSHRLVDQLRAIGGSIAVSAETRDEFERKFIDPWLADHPLQDLTFVRESPIARFAEQTRERGDTLQSVGTLEELFFTLSQQARIYFADLPRQLRGEVDLMRSDVLPAETVTSMRDDLHTSAGAADRIAATAESLSGIATNERQIILNEMSRQRGLIMEAVSVEREQAIGAMVASFAAERTELLSSVHLQRLATLEWATAERREAITELRREMAASMETLRAERVAVVADVRRIVDGVLLRVALFLIAAVLLAPLVAHAYARVWPRRWRSRAGSSTGM